MSSQTTRSVLPVFLAFLILILACNLPFETSSPLPAGPNPSQQPSEPELDPATATLDSAGQLSVVSHKSAPSLPSTGKLVYDVESQCTSAELRAPYGDSYKINRLERPFLQNMSYVPDLDIVTYLVGEDGEWWYVSIQLMGADPNNTLGINYGVEIDLDRDGFGDYIIWAHPPYTTEWDTVNVQIFQDKNHNTGGASGEKSDAPRAGDGYEILVFNGGASDADPDMAWVRMNGTAPASIQFAFKKSWAGSVFMLGVLADAGLKDVGRLDYVDRMTEAEAGSPIKEKQYYPLKALFAVDNACREAFGFAPNGYEPQLCPREAPPTKKPADPQEPPPVITGCQDPGNCPYGWAGEPYCYCIPG
jgi:hypothetical protein